MRPSDPVNRIMSEPAVSIDLGAPAAEVMRLFAVHPFHHLPVVDREKVVGMLSSADVLKLEAFLPKRGKPSAEFVNQHLHIGQLMRRPPITVAGTQPVEQATRLMAQHGIHALPVTDSNDKLVGIITTTDIINAVLHKDQCSGALGAAIMEAPGDVAPPAAIAAQEREASLHAQSRLRALEEVLVAADRYVHAGQDQNLHRVLVKAINKAKDESADMLRDRL